MWCLETRFSGRLGKAGLMVGPNDFKGLFQPKQFYGGVMLGTKPATELAQHADSEVL